MAVTYKYTLICDDARREDNGKMLYIGVYTGGDILVPQLPFILPSLTFVMAFSVDTPTRIDMRFRVQLLESGQTLMEGRGGGMFTGGQTVLPIRFGNVSLQAVGIYNFIVEIDGIQEPIITEFAVRLNVQQSGAPQRPR